MLAPMSSENIWTDFARTYDVIIPRLFCYAAVAQKVYRTLAPYPVVLDAGCGTGIQSEGLVRRDHTVFGFDNNPAMLARALEKQERLAEHGVAARWRIQAGDVVSFPDEAPGDADAVLMNNVIFYVADVQDALAQARAHLRDGGMILVTGPRRRPDMEKVLSEETAAWTRAGRDLDELHTSITEYVGLARQLVSGAEEMVTFFTPDELTEALREAGFCSVVCAEDTDYYGENYFVAMTA
jgi:SAM-dependent methyltransferase